MTDTLILNADSTPLSLIPMATMDWQEAIKLVYLDKINVLSTYDEWCARSPSITMPIPSVIIVRRYIRTSRLIYFNRYNVFLRDLFVCQYCLNRFPYKQLNLDHVIPESKGGLTNWENVVTSCYECNSGKSDQTIAPNQMPHKPSYGELLNNRRSLPVVVPLLRRVG